MIKNACLAKEIVVSVVNKIGVLADMSEVVAGHGVNIEAVVGYAKGDNTADIMLVTSDPGRTAESLEKVGYKAFKENEVIIVDLENKPGALKYITAKLAAEGIDLVYVYGTACPAKCPARIVFSTTDNKKALEIFQKK